MMEMAEKIEGDFAVIRRAIRCLSILGLLTSLAISPAHAQVDESDQSPPDITDQSSLPPTTFGGPAIVIDSKKNQVGLLTTQNIFGQTAGALRKIKGIWFVLPVSAAGFSDTGGENFGADVNLFYGTSNCTGTAYLPVTGSLVTTVSDSFSGVSKGILYYPTPSTFRNCAKLSFNSLASLTRGSASCSPFAGNISACDETGDASIQWGQATSFNLSTLGLSPPFSVFVKGIQ
jgi:hypothetical protein